MSTAISQVSCTEKRPPPEESLELVNNDTPSYPDNWPLPPTPLPSCSGSSKDGEDLEPTPTGVFTPPLQRPTAQLTPPMSSSNNTRPLRSLSNPLAKSNHRKRLSLSFPIAPSVYTSPHTPTTPTEHDQPSPNDSVAFLTALAAQERRVLELREELSKAECELTKLKRQWTIHEATKKRHDLLQTEIIRGAGIGDAVEGWRNSPIDESEAKKRAALAKLTQPSTRGVNGQRHHRTLSLLSPQRASNPHSFPQPRDLQDADGESVNISTTLRRSDTLPNPPTRPLSVTEISNASVSATPGIKRNSQEVLMRTGKQMAEGFKEGLWAFVEDLKHATVGEGIPSGPSGAPTSRCSSSMEVTLSGLRKKGSKNSLRSMSNSERGKSPDSWQENGPISTSSSLRWSTASTTLSETSSVSTSHSRSSTPRTSTRYRDHLYIYHLLHLTPILAYICSLLPRPANNNIHAFFHQLGPIFQFHRRRSGRGSASLGNSHISGDTV